MGIEIVPFRALDVFALCKSSLPPNREITLCVWGDLFILLFAHPLYTISESEALAAAAS